MGSLIGLVFLIIVVGGLFLSTVKIVPQGSVWIAERFGKFRAELQPGLNILVPYIDRVAYKMTTKDDLIDIPSQECITEDNAIIEINGLVFVKITDPQKAAYGVDNYANAIVGISGPLLRNVIGTMTLDESLSSREKIKVKFKTELEDQMNSYGLQIRSVDIRDILPSTSMQQAMEQQAAAERARKATQTRAEGEKQAAILKAEGVKQSTVLEAEAKRDAAILEAEAIKTMAGATRDAVELIASTSATEAGRHALGYQLGVSYIQTVGNLGAADNAKTVFMPADIAAAVAPFTTAGVGFGVGQEAKS